MNAARWVTLLLAVVMALPAMAENLLMSRVGLKAEIVFAYVESSIQEHGYQIAHVQTCDDGLGDFGYKTDFYRTVFFGKVGEVQRIVADYPELASYVPLKMAVIAERDETVLVILNPQALAPFFADEWVQIQLARWYSDLVSILEQVSRETAAHRAAD
jgi:uncharacterized protein (DUF302 family)